MTSLRLRFAELAQKVWTKMSAEDSLSQQAAFAQKKLEKHYTSIYKALFEYQYSIEVIQRVLVWKRPALSLALYAFVHWIFV